jgi:hypothetical protein
MSQTHEDPADCAFGDFFEKRFRRSPIVIGLGMIVGSFATGFSAHAALTREANEDHGFAIRGRCVVHECACEGLPDGSGDLPPLR